MEPIYKEKFVSFHEAAYSHLLNNLEWLETGAPRRLKSGSLFIMPAGFQEKYQHKIPKHCSECSGRISLTFRRYVEA